MNKLRKIFDPLILLTLFSLILSILIQTTSNPTFFTWFFFILTVIGFLLIFYSKYPHIKKGMLFSFGLKYLKGRPLFLYLTGWLLIFLGICFLYYFIK